jgi:hypothetical protein
MTKTNDAPRRSRRPLLAIGLLMLVLSAGSFVVSASFMMYEVTGWPWHSSFSTQSESGRTTATISDDGEFESFTGSEEQASAWMDRKEAELQAKHGIDTKLAVGRALGPVSLALLALGGASLTGYFVGLVRNRRGHQA